ncbi:MAG TPA: hypothetical protein VFX84_00190, partial [Candidatus Saccharimonadales bacterium]|nr:hypothetical protein [Candidatus Saccharimonadales bacterium]
ADTIVGGISEFASNNNGARPTALTAVDGSVELSGAAGTTPTTAKVPGSITVVKINFVPPNAIVQANSGYIGVRFEHSCDDTASTNPRATAVYYVIETSGDNKLECADG